MTNYIYDKKKNCYSIKKQRDILSKHSVYVSVFFYVYNSASSQSAKHCKKLNDKDITITYSVISMSPGII